MNKKRGNITKILAVILALALTLGLSLGAPLRIAAAEDSQEDAGAPDPVEVVYALALKEIEDFRVNVNEESAKLFVDNEDIIGLISDYADILKEAVSSVRIWSVASDTRDAEALYQELRLTVQSVMNSYGTYVIAASSVIQNLNPDNSYPFGWPIEDDRCYLAEIYEKEKTLAVMACWFNDDGAIQTAVIPMVGDAAFDFEDIYPMAEDWKVRERSWDLLKRLRSAKPEKDLDEYMQMMLKRVAAHAGQDYLTQMNVPDAAMYFASQCKRFAGKPYAVLSWSSSEIGEAIMELLTELSAEESGEELSEDMRQMAEKYLLSIMDGTVLNGMIGAEPLSASSVVSTSYAVSGLEDEDTFRWYYFKNPDGGSLVCAVSAVRNGNDCYDFSAAPVYYSDFTEQVLEMVRNGGDEEISSENTRDAMLLFLVRYAEEIEP